MDTPFIVFENATLKIGNRLAFENTNWFWRTNQHWAIVGPNGSGKSIFTQALSRRISLFKGVRRYFFHDKVNGEAFFSSGDIVTVSPVLHQELMQGYTGYYQSRWESVEEIGIPCVSEFLSGNGNHHCSPYEISEAKHIRGGDLDQREKILTLLGIKNLLNRKIHRLSNGETRKVMIARALMQPPKLLILDDPFGGLDVKSRANLQTTIENIIATDETKILLAISIPEEIPEGITHLLHVSNCKIAGEEKVDRKNQNRSMDPPIVNDPVDVPNGGFSVWADPYKNCGAKLVEMRDVSVSYGGVAVLSEISWEIQQGDRWAVFGPNGAGKSTLLSLITADNPQAYANDIHLFGKRRGDGESIWDIKDRIGFMSPELQGCYKIGFTCLEVVCSGYYNTIGLYRSCSKKQRNAAVSLLKQLGIDYAADTLFNLLSLGEQRLALLGRALVKNPVLLVLDEPCQGVDALHRKIINRLLDTLCNGTNLTMIYVTHYPDELPGAITHQLMMNDGRIMDMRIA